MMKLLGPSALLLTTSLLAQNGDDALLAGMTALKKKDHTTASSAFDRAVVEDPTNGKTWYYRAVNRMVVGDNQGALNDLDRALTLKPADVHALLRRAEVNRTLGKPERANSDLHRVLGLNADGPAAEHALLELGRLAMEADDLPTARQHYDQLVAMAPYSAMAWCNRGIVHNALLDDEKAIADLEKASELDPTLDQAYATLALVYFRQGRMQEGCYTLQQAKDLGDMSVEELLLVHCNQ